MTDSTQQGVHAALLRNTDYSAVLDDLFIRARRPPVGFNGWSDPRFQEMLLRYCLAERASRLESDIKARKYDVVLELIAAHGQAVGKAPA